MFKYRTFSVSYSCFYFSNCLNTSLTTAKVVASPVGLNGPSGHMIYLRGHEIINEEDLYLFFLLFFLVIQFSNIFFSGVTFSSSFREPRKKSNGSQLMSTFKKAKCCKWLYATDISLLSVPGHKSMTVVCVTHSVHVWQPLRSWVPWLRLETSPQGSMWINLSSLSSVEKALCCITSNCTPSCEWAIVFWCCC